MLDITKQQKIKKWFDENKENTIKNFMYQISPTLESNLHTKELYSCMSDGCLEEPISSHVFQKSAIMYGLSLDSHIYMPNFCVKENKVLMKRESIDEPATFPGYCIEHDEIFKEFETRKLLIDEKDFILQIYRSVCKELLVNRALEKSNDDLFNEIKNYFLVNIKKVFTRKNRDIIEESEELIYLEGLSKEYLESIKNLRNKEPNEPFDSAYKKIYLMYSLITERINENQYSFENMSKDFYIKRITLPCVLPVAVSDRVNSFNTLTSEYNLFLMISFPNGEKQEIIFFALKEDTHYVLRFLSEENSKNNKDIVTLLEKLIVTNANFWFLSPSYYDSLSDIQRAELNTKISQGAFEHNMNTIGDVFNFEIK